MALLHCEVDCEAVNTLPLKRRKSCEHVERPGICPTATGTDETRFLKALFEKKCRNNIALILLLLFLKQVIISFLICRSEF
jgi:hypothetical protein